MANFEVDVNILLRQYLSNFCPETDVFIYTLIH